MVESGSIRLLRISIDHFGSSRLTDFLGRFVACRINYLNWFYYQDLGSKMNPSAADKSKKLEMKSLENMMQECTNRIGKDAKNPKQSYSSSQASANWKGHKPPRFPSWCCKEIVPALYHHVESYVTSEGRHEISNSLLLPVLLSSGLQREVLAHIWELTNQGVPGVLSPQELYATLAIVALYQSGYNVQSAEALHYFPAPPLPFLQLPAPMFVPPMPTEVTGGPPGVPLTSTTPPITSSTFPLATPPISSTPPLPSTTPPLFTTVPNSQPQDRCFNNTIVETSQATSQTTLPLFVPQPPQPIGLFNTGHGFGQQVPTSISQTAADEEFADFQSSAPPILHDSADDFGDFKQADIPLSFPVQPISSNSRIEKPNSGFSLTTTNTTAAALVETKDRYAVFRTLDEEFDGQQLTADVNEQLNSTIPDFSDPNEQLNTSVDDFGDFLSAPISLANVLDIQAVKPIEIPTVNVDFEADNFKKIVDWGSVSAEVKARVDSPVFTYEVDNLDAISLSSFHHSPLRVRNLDQEDDISFDKISFNHISGEALSDPTTQSISSQESATDPALENSDPESADKSVSSLPITDRYSFIRSEPLVVTLDKVVSEWTRVLDKCKDILIQSKEIFLSGKEASVMDELFQTQEISDYVKNLTCVYCVVRRIYTSAHTSGRFAGDLQEKLTQLDALWNDLHALLYNHHKLPIKTALDFSPSSASTTLATSCGLCLLDTATDSDSKLTYGGREYHASCANFWVNTVDFTLPALCNSEFV